jgi:hypothetical protein
MPAAEIRFRGWKDTAKGEYAMTEDNEQTQESWTEEDTAAYTRAPNTFQDDLPQRQRDAFIAIAADAQASTVQEGDVEGYASPALGGVGRISGIEKLQFGVVGLTGTMGGEIHNPYDAEHGPG